MKKIMCLPGHGFLDDFDISDNNKRFMKNAQIQGQNMASSSADIFDLAPSTAAKYIETEKSRIQRKIQEFTRR